MSKLRKLNVSEVQGHAGTIFPPGTLWIDTFNNLRYSDGVTEGGLPVTSGVSLITPSAGADNNGIVFPNNPGGGGGDTASIKWYPIEDETMRLHVNVQNDNDDEIFFESSGPIKVQSNENLWIYGTDGALTLPDTTVVSQGFISGGACNHTAGISNFSGWSQVYAQDENVGVQTSPDGNAYYTWLFSGSDGLLYVPNGADNTSGIAFPNDAGGGSGDFSYIHYYPYAGGEDMVLELRVRNNSDDRIRLDTSGDIEIVTDGPGVGQKWVFHDDGTFAFPDNTRQTTAYDNKLLKVTSTTPATANATTKYIICDPNAASGNVEITLPNGNFSGKEYTIKNINDGGYSVNISLANGSAYIEDSGGSFGTSVSISATGGYATWVWDEDALTYRIMSNNL